MGKVLGVVRASTKNWNGSEGGISQSRNYPRESCIHRLFEQQVRRSPNATAVVFPSDEKTQQLTYQELNEAADKLAVLLQCRGVKLRTPVVLFMERSHLLIVAILAILKAGGVYVPIDPSYPQERIAWMLEDSCSPLILTQSSQLEELSNYEADVICLDQNWRTLSDGNSVSQPVSVAVQATDLAYINYTSGSTGKPKGVMIPHRGVIRLVFSTEYTPLDGQQTFLQLAPISFDAATLEIWGALLHGGCCVLYPGNGFPDPQTLRTIIQTYGVTTLWLTAALFNTLITEAPECLQGVQELLTGGEALSVQHIRLAQKLLPETNFVNGYGPTESTTFTCCYRIPRPLEAELSSIPIGKAIANTEVYILDEQLQPVAEGAEGELYIGGDGLAQGYLNQPELTAERFIAHPFNSHPEAKLFKTGDLVRCRADGNIEFLGRRDHQVKIRGYRIELGEIENQLLQQESVKDAVVLCREDQPGQKILVAYLVAKPGNVLQIQILKGFLRKTLPDYMVPNAILILEEIPLTPNGKVNRKALPKPVLATKQQNIVAPSTKMEATLANLWCGILGLEQVSVEDNFFDLGGTSLLGLRLIARIQKQLKLDLPAVKLYQYTTVRAMARYLTQCTTSNRPPQRIRKSSQPQQLLGKLEAPPRTDSEAIAIIGMVGRFPGADTVEEFWQNLCAGKDSITFFQPEELDPSVDPELSQDANYVPARGILQGAELFDAAFFNISPREAEVMDPQARVFLELSHQALETVGYPAEQFPGAIGLYAGSGHNTYFEHYICRRSQIVNRLGPFQTMLANEKDFVTTRIAYKLNLKGPVLSINTACSTSLVATIQAFQGLMAHQCDLALAGGVSITTPQKTGYLYQEGGMLSPDGKCRPFDAKGQGTLFNDGAALVVLKRLSDAEKDGDRIYAVIRGVGMNNDGSDKVSFTAPSVNGQIEAILQAQEMAGIEPETISYIETHGTATPLGDPIEIEALTQAFRIQTSAQQFCGIGSVKSNVGHLVAAAGVAGLIKTALSLYHRQIPPSLYFETPNPEIDFANSPFYVNTTLRDWAETSTPRRAGVSSFGVGGTNAHVILEEAPTSPPQPVVSPRPYQLLLLSAKTETALNQLTVSLKTYLQGNSQINLADVAYTLQQGRQRFNQRRFVVCSNPTDAVQRLDTLDPKFSATRNMSRQNPEVAFMFPGQGSQYVNMGRNLYEREPIFRQAVNRCAEILQPVLGRDIRAVIYPDLEQVEASATLLRQTLYTQPALFTVEYALALLWQSWGVQPTAFIGHSIGEFVAACLAGIFSVEDGLKLVAQRGKLMWDLPAGAMLSVRLSAEALEPKLPEGVTIAAVNSPVLCVASGSTELIDALQSQLETEEVVCKRLHTSHAFHSPMMDSIVEPFTNLVKTIPLTPPQIPIVSTATGKWLTDEQATDPHYWANHLRRAVQFAPGIQTLWQNPQRVLLEVGPRKTATTLARQQAQNLEEQIAISSLGSTAENQAEWSAILFAMGQLWQSGVDLDYPSFYLNEPRTRLPLPTYPFERQRFWIDEPLVDKQLVNEESISSEHSISSQNPSTMPISETQVRTDSRQNRLIPLITEVLENTSGIAMTGVDEVTTFLELGLDSLSLTQVALALTKKFKVKVSFRQLLEDYPNLKTLSERIDQSLPPEAFPAPAPPAVNGSQPVEQSPVSVRESASHSQPQNMNGIQSLVAQQLQIMAQQLALLNQSSENINSISTTAQPTQKPEPQPVVNYVNGNGSNGNGSNGNGSNGNASNGTAKTTTSSRPAPGVKINKSKSNALTAAQQKALEQMMARYTTRTTESKRQAQEHRRYLADPRTVSGFTPLLKEMVYPIVTERAKGSKLWDVDGNEYIDLTNGFGLNFFGWSPDFVAEAVKAQLDKGIEIGPQTPLAGKVAKLITEFTGMERVAFCNTGSEAVMAALRISRTVTARDQVVIFSGAYHGTFDEVLVHKGPNLKSLPAAPGLMNSMFENVLVLDYGEPESLEILRNRADDLAAIMVEPVQSRKPELQPREFLQELRQLTEKSGTALIFDEVVTGFRVHPGGAQAYFDIKADIATYGKVIGGGLPIGVVAGKSTYMDALDGGFWQFGDDSIPEVGVTFFAGTFVRHPMAMAAAEAVLNKLKQEGPQLQQSLAEKVEKFATHLTQHFQRVGAPIKVAHFSSFFYVTYDPQETYGSLLFYLLREKGVHIWEYRPCFFTLSHSNADIEHIIWAFKESVAEMQLAGLLSGSTKATTINRNRPPQPGARLGKDPAGNPAWFIPDPNRPGKYLQLGETL